MISGMQMYSYNNCWCTLCIVQLERVCLQPAKSENLKLGRKRREHVPGLWPALGTAIGLTQQCRRFRANYQCTWVGLECPNPTSSTNFPLGRSETWISELIVGWSKYRPPTRRQRCDGTARHPRYFPLSTARNNAISVGLEWKDKARSLSGLSIRILALQIARPTP